MVKHTETIRRLLPTNCLSVFDHFVGLALKGLICFQIMKSESYCFKSKNNKNRQHNLIKSNNNIIYRKEDQRPWKDFFINRNVLIQFYLVRSVQLLQNEFNGINKIPLPSRFRENSLVSF